jgi:tetratricopeptide (TPR) repeat protein
MPIEGPLRELGIHDVFQLLDLSRKTGALSVVSALRDNQGTVFFDGGAVVFASIRSNPHRLGDMLVRAGKISEADLNRARAIQQKGDSRRLGEILLEIGVITPKELERHVRLHIEEVVFELMSWREGYFSFEERPIADAPSEASVRISTESLLMEGARRIDEWSRIEGKVPHVGVVPVLAPLRADHPSLLDLLPNEWEVLAEIDGAKDLREIALRLGQSDFDIAKVVYGMVTTGVIDLRDPRLVTPQHVGTPEDARPHVERARALLEGGNAEGALAAARQAIAADPQFAAARVAMARVLSKTGRLSDAAEELRRALQLDPLHPETHLEMGYCAAARGDLNEAMAAWERYLRMLPNGGDAARVREALASAAALHGLLTGRAHG